MCTLLPKTPSQAHMASPSFNAQPIKSSPLATHSSQVPSSPVEDAQARRRLQFKSKTNTAERPLAKSKRYFYPASTNTNETPQTRFLRELFKASCAERVRKSRERSVVKQRRMYESSDTSDGFDVEMDIGIERSSDDEDSEIFDDELFRRIIVSERRRLEHSYRVSYERNVGSSFDPALEDISEWEDYLANDEQHTVAEDVPEGIDHSDSGDLDSKNEPLPLPEEEYEFDDEWSEEFDRILLELEQTSSEMKSSTTPNQDHGSICLGDSMMVEH